MRREQEAPKSPPSPDRLYDEMRKHHSQARHASQFLPDYSEFRLGHGDPLMKAVMKHWVKMAVTPPPSPKRVSAEKKKVESFDDDKEIHLIEHGSPLGGCGFNDVIHIDKNTTVTFPCIPRLQDNTDDDDDDDDEDDSDSDSDDDQPPQNEKDHLIEHGSPVGGMGFNDIVHIDKDHVVCMPILPHM